MICRLIDTMAIIDHHDNNRSINQLNHNQFTALILYYTNTFLCYPRPYYIASCSRDNSIRIWTIDSGGKCVQVMYNTDETQLTSLSICDNGKIITGTDNGLVKRMTKILYNVFLATYTLFSTVY